MTQLEGSGRDKYSLATDRTEVLLQMLETRNRNKKTYFSTLNIVNMVNYNTKNTLEQC